LLGYFQSRDRARRVRWHNNPQDKGQSSGESSRIRPAPNQSNKGAIVPGPWRQVGQALFRLKEWRCGIPAQEDAAGAGVYELWLIISLERISFFCAT
jgi:hypothetical protein